MNPDAALRPASPGGPATVIHRVALLVVAASLAASGVLLLARARHAEHDASVTNRALTDASATTGVIGEVTTALDQVLSYNYRTPRVAQAAAHRWLTGDAPGQYRTLFAQLQRLAPGQRLTLTAKVSTGGVTMLRGDHAQLLMFLDQQSTRASDGQSSVSAAQVQIDAVRHDGRWKIDELLPL